MFWERLGAVLDRPGAVLERLGPLLSFQNPPKIAPKNLQDASIFNGNPRLKLKKNHPDIKTINIFASLAHVDAS